MNRARFIQFLGAMDTLVKRTTEEATLLDQGEAALRELIEHDDWLPPEYCVADATRYQSYALYIDPMKRYSVISFVWDPGQGTPIHNHTVWGMVGVLRGAERCEEFPVPGGADMNCLHAHTLSQGEVDCVSPRIGDWHRVQNAMPDQRTISIHVYGADIGRVQRSFIDSLTHEVKPMVTGYNNTMPWISAR